MKVGDKVRLIGIPAGLEDFPDMDDMPGLKTKFTFERCLGHEFVVSAVTDEGRVELPVFSVTGHRNEKIYVSPACLELVSGAEIR